MTDTVKLLSDDALREIEAREPETAYALGQPLVSLTPEERDVLCATVRSLRDWKESALPLLNRYESLAETFGGKLGSLRVENLERGVAALRGQLAQMREEIEGMRAALYRSEL